MNIINLTPHELTLVGNDGQVLARFPPSGQVLRLVEKTTSSTNLVHEGVEIPLLTKSVGAAEDLPPREEGTLYIVSLPVALRYPERDDFVVPHDYVRDENGRVLGCRALARVGGEYDD